MGILAMSHTLELASRAEISPYLFDEASLQSSFLPSSVKILSKTWQVRLFPLE
jgi:hypothetical protein